MVDVDQVVSYTPNPSFRPAAEVADEVVLDLVGTLPQELQGTLFRNGPGRFEAGGFHATHPFDGDGLISKFVIDSGQVRFRSRFVRTPKFAREEAGRGAGVRGVFTQARSTGRNFARLPADSANTHAIHHAGRLMALSDAGSAWSIDPADLTTLGRCDFDGRLPRRSRFSPHPKIDPVSGELFNFGIDVGFNGARIPAVLRCYRVDPTGRMSVIGKVPLDHVLVQHDFAITERYLVFALAPITIAPVQGLLAGLGIGDFGTAADYRPHQGMKVVLVPRAGGPNRVIECDPLVYVHVDNAYDDHGDVVLDLVRYDSFDFLVHEIKEFRTAGLPDLGSPARLRITTNDRVLVEERDDVVSVEFPTHDERRTGREHRYSYFAQLVKEGECAIVKVDHQTGEQRSHQFADGEFPGEPVFVPRSNTAAEDDGWLLSVTYLAAEHRTALVVLDARRIEAAPVAVARVDGHFFTGFHGSFVPGMVSG